MGSNGEHEIHFDNAEGKDCDPLATDRLTILQIQKDLQKLLKISQITRFEHTIRRLMIMRNEHHDIGHEIEIPPD